MNKEQHIKTVHLNDEVYIYNKVSKGMVVITNHVFDIIKGLQSYDYLDHIAGQYSEEDVDFFSSLKEAFLSKEILKSPKKNEIERVTYAITDDCNLFCTHCCYSAKVVSGNRTTKTLADIKLLDKIIKMAPKHITFTGGEPLLVHNFNEIMQYLEDHFDGESTLATNAVLINELNVKRLIEVFSAFEISLDGYDSESCDKIRGEGVFEQVMNSIKLLKENGAKRIVVSMAVDNDTKDYEEKFVALCESLDLGHKIRAMNLIGRAEKNHVSSSDVLNITNGSILNVVGEYDCPGGRREVFIDSKGDMYPCGLFNTKAYKIGNIYDKSKENIISWNTEAEWFKSFGQLIPEYREGCKDCEVNSFCWNCPALIDSYMREHQISDLSDYCKVKKEEILESLRYE